MLVLHFSIHSNPCLCKIYRFDISSVEHIILPAQKQSRSRNITMIIVLCQNYNENNNRCKQCSWDNASNNLGFLKSHRFHVGSHVVSFVFQFVYSQPNWWCYLNQVKDFVLWPPHFVVLGCSSFASATDTLCCIPNNSHNEHDNMPCMARQLLSTTS